MRMMSRPSDRLKMLVQWLVVSAVFFSLGGCHSPDGAYRRISPDSTEARSILPANIVVLPFGDNRDDYHLQVYYSNGVDAGALEKQQYVHSQFPDSESLRTLCESEMMRFPFFRFTSRENLDAVLAEHNFQKNALWSSDSKRIYEVGRALGARFLLIGYMSGSDIEMTAWPRVRRFTLSLKLVDINGLETIPASSTVYLNYSYWGNIEALSLQGLVAQTVSKLATHYAATRQPTE